MISQRIRASEIPFVDLTGERRSISIKISRVIIRLFQRPDYLGILPFRGFLLEGPPGNGKTEIAKQAARIVGSQLRNYNVYFMFIDSADIASPKWGDAENKIRRIFRVANDQNSKTILLFDDIDCFMIKRGAEISKEWHYSINSVLFHEIDNLNPSRIIILATSNKPHLIDDALRSRLYSIQVPAPTIDDLIEIAKQILLKNEISAEKIDRIIEDIKNKILNEKKHLSIRTIQHELVIKCIEEELL